MHREMRRSGQSLPREEVIEILTQAGTMTLALDDGGQPYAVPLNFVFSPSGSWGTVFFHCAAEGRKIDAIRSNGRVSLCVIAEDRVVPETFSTVYRSAVAFGRAKILTDDKEKTEALVLLTAKYCPGESREKIDEEISRSLPRTCVVAVTVEHATGKRSRD